MARYAKLFNSFTGGEIGPSVLGRVDVPQYQNGCELLQNFICTKTGGVIRRPGSILGRSRDTWADTESDNHVSRILPYVYSSEFAYEIELSNNLISIFRTNENFLPNGQTVTVTNSTNGYSRSSLDSAKPKITSSGVDIYLAHPDEKPKRIVRTLQNQFTVYDYDDDSLFDSITEKIKVIPFQDLNATSTTMTTSGSTGTVTLTASADVVWGDYLRIEGSGSSAILEIGSVASGTSATATFLTGFDLAAAASATTDWYMSAWGQDWSALPDGLGLGYPNAVTFYQQRLAYGGTTYFPDTLWFSESANQNRFLRDALDQWTGELQTGNAAAVQVTLASPEVNRINWLLDAGRGDLGIGTASDEWVGFAPDSSAGFGPSNLRFDRQSAYGSANTQPVFADGTLVFLQRDGKTLRTLEFSDTSGKYISNDLTALAPHLIEDTYDVRETLWDYNPQSGENETARFEEIAYDTTFGCIWALTNFGDLFSCAFSREYGVSAWSRHQLGGKYEFGIRDDPAQEQAPRVRSLAVIPGTHDDVVGTFRDFIYLSVTRLLGQRVGTLNEYIAPPFVSNTLDFSVDVNSGSDTVYGISDIMPVYLDCAWSGRAGNAVTNSFDTTKALGSVFQDEWRGIEVSVVADGKVLSDVTVANDDTIDLTDDYSTYCAGFKYTHKLRTTRIEQGSRIGTSQGLIHRIDRAVARLFRSAQLTMGDPEDTSKLEEVTFDRIDGNSANPIALFNGDKEVLMPSSHGGDPYVYIEGDDPLPLNIAAIVALGEVYER